MLFRSSLFAAGVQDKCLLLTHARKCQMHCTCAVKSEHVEVRETQDPGPSTSGRLEADQQQQAQTSSSRTRRLAVEISGIGSEKELKWNREQEFLLSQVKLRASNGTRDPTVESASKSLDNDIFMGRIAMVLFAASIAAEAAMGTGPLGLLNVETGIPLAELDGLVVFVIALNLSMAFTPKQDDNFIPEEELLEPDEVKLPGYKGARKAWKRLQRDWRRGGARLVIGTVFGTVLASLDPSRVVTVVSGGPSSGVMTRKNEVIAGRIAQLGFSGVLLGEALTGKGAMAQLGLEGAWLAREFEGSLPAVLLALGVGIAALLDRIRNSIKEE